MPETILTDLLREYKEKQDTLNGVTTSIDIEIARLQTYRDGLAKPLYDILQDLETKIKTVMLETKETYTCMYGRITYKKGGVRRSWDLEALDSVCEFDQHIKEVIWAHRRETPFAPTVSIKLNK